jgi:hypothetical protein
LPGRRQIGFACQVDQPAFDHVPHRVHLRLEERSGMIIMDYYNTAGRGPLIGQKKRVGCLANAGGRDELSAQPPGEQDYFCLGSSVS